LLDFLTETCQDVGSGFRHKSSIPVAVEVRRL
jgi:hypothetical protein